MDLAKESKPSLKINRKLITLVLNLPGLWLTLHIFRAAFVNSQGSYSSQYLWNPELNTFIIEEFKGYRNSFYLLYIIVFVISGLLIMGRGLKKTNSKGMGEINSENAYQYIVPGAIQGLILVTFSYAIAGFLLDLYIIITRLI